jgi:arylformamidase
MGRLIADAALRRQNGEEEAALVGRNGEKVITVKLSRMFGPRLNRLRHERADVHFLRQLEFGQQVVLARGRVDLRHVCSTLSTMSAATSLAWPSSHLMKTKMAVIMAAVLPRFRRCVADGDVADKAVGEIDYEAEYNNRARVPGHPAVLARWKAAAEAARAAHPPETLAYGPGEREVMDLFSAGDDAPVAVFLHGGYWQALDKDWCSGFAPAFLERGVSLAIPSYGLAPAVRLGAILKQVRTAVDLVRARNGGKRPVVLGHSAGGHMAACMLSEARASAAVAISGVFDLRPLIPTSLNAALGLDENEAAALSPVFWAHPQRLDAGRHRPRLRRRRRRKPRVPASVEDDGRPLGQ